MLTSSFIGLYSGSKFVSKANSSSFLLNFDVFIKLLLQFYVIFTHFQFKINKDTKLPFGVDHKRRSLIVEAERGGFGGKVMNFKWKHWNKYLCTRNLEKKIGWKMEGGKNSLKLMQLSEFFCERLSWTWFFPFLTNKYINEWILNNLLFFNHFEPDLSSVLNLLI